MLSPFFFEPPAHLAAIQRNLRNETKKKMEKKSTFKPYKSHGCNMAPTQCDSDSVGDGDGDKMADQMTDKMASATLEGAL